MVSLHLLKNSCHGFKETRTRPHHALCSSPLLFTGPCNTVDEFCYFSGHFSNVWRSSKILTLASDIFARSTKLRTKKFIRILHCKSSTFFFCCRPPWRAMEAVGTRPSSSSQASFLGYMPPRNWLYRANSTFCTAGEPFLYSFRQAIDENTERRLPRTDPSGSPWWILSLWQQVPNNFPEFSICFIDSER